jgi:hypothetical protein
MREGTAADRGGVLKSEGNRRVGLALSRGRGGGNRGGKCATYFVFDGLLPKAKAAREVTALLADHVRREIARLPAPLRPLAEVADRAVVLPFFPQLDTCVLAHLHEIRQTLAPTE